MPAKAGLPEDAGGGMPRGLTLYYHAVNGLSSRSKCQRSMVDMSLPSDRGGRVDDISDRIGMISQQRGEAPLHQPG